MDCNIYLLNLVICQLVITQTFVFKLKKKILKNYYKKIEKETWYCKVGVVTKASKRFSTLCCIFLYSQYIFQNCSLYILGPPLK